MISAAILSLAWIAADGSNPMPPQWGGELRFALRSDPKTFDPLLSADQPSELLIYLLHDRLIHWNRKTQKFEPALAESWKVVDQGRRIVLQLRRGVQFSDGSPLTSKDIAYTVNRVADPAVNSPKAGAFRPEHGKVLIESITRDRLSITFPTIVPSIEAEVSGLPILSNTGDFKLGLGPFVLREYKAAAHLQLVRNPNYWRTESGRRLPYLDSLRIDVVSNADIEMERFRRGEIHLLDNVDPLSFDRLQKDLPGTALDVGPSFDVEFFWFNQAPTAPIAAHKLVWFRSKNFRRAISAAVHREDIIRLVFQNRGTQAAGLASPANKAWYKHGLTPHSLDLGLAKKLLRQDGFRWQGETLVDASNHPVEFSLITNANNKTRARIASILQQDLAKLGIRINISTFDFPSLVERIGRTLNYEACLLGLVNVNPDPMGMMNVLLSSGPQHMWNPAQKTPATAWETEIDKAMQMQASTADLKKRRSAFDRVQQILSDEAPMLFLAHRNTLVAFSTRIGRIDPSAEFPRLLWNSERLVWGAR